MEKRCTYQWTMLLMENLRNILQVAIRESKFTIKLNKPVYVEIGILIWVKYDEPVPLWLHLKWKCINSRSLFTDTDSMMYEIKTEDAYEYFSKDKEMFAFSNYSAQLKYYDSNKLVIGRKKDGLKLKVFSFLVDDSSEHKKAMGVNKNVVSTISHSEYKEVLLNKRLRHLMNKIQSKNHKIETCKINIISLSCFDDKIYIPSNRYDGLALGY